MEALNAPKMMMAFATTINSIPEINGKTLFCDLESTLEI